MSAVCFTGLKNRLRGLSRERSGRYGMAGWCWAQTVVEFAKDGRRRQAGAVYSVHT